MKRSIWQVVLLLVLGFCATPAGAHTLSSLLACIPDGGGGMMPTMIPDSFDELPAGG
jgi:hypothetical protein